MRLNRHNKLLAPVITVGLLAGLGGTACGSSSPPQTCNTPRAVSDWYPGGYPGVTSDRATWWVLQALTSGDAQGLVSITASYRTVKNGDWTNSKPLRPPDGEELLFKVGPPPGVQVSEFETFAAGSAACGKKPLVEFGNPAPPEQPVGPAALYPNFGK